MYNKNVSRFSFNLAPRIIHVATLVVRVGAMRYLSAERSLLALTLRGIEKIETKIVH